MPALSLEVGALFEVEDRATPVLAEIAEMMEKLTGIAREAAAALEGVARNIGLGPLLEQAGAASAAIARIGEGATAMASGIERGVVASRDAIASLVTQAGEARTAISSIGDVGTTGLSRAATEGAAAAASIGRIRTEAESTTKALSDMTTKMGDGFIANQRLLGGMTQAGEEAAREIETDPLAERMSRIPPEQRPWDRVVGPMSTVQNRLPEEEPEEPGRLGRPRAAPRAGMSIMDMLPPELVAPLALYEAMKTAGSEIDSLTATALALHIDPRTEEGHEAIARLREGAEGAAAGTTFSERQVAGGMAALARPLGLTGEVGLEKFIPLFEEAAKAAEATERLHLGKYEDTLGGIVEFLHLSGVYDPKEAHPLIELLGAVTQQIPHATMSEEARVMSYVVPIGRTLGVPEADLIERVGFLQRAGLRGTVASTTVRQEFMGLMRDRGPTAGHLRHAEDPKSELSRALHLDARERHEVGRRARDPDHTAAMKEAGLLDAKGHETFLTPDGKLDMHKVDDILAEFGKTHPRPFDQAKMADRLFGVRGQQAEELFLMSRERSEDFHKTITTTMPLAEQQKRLAETPSGEMSQALARLSDIMNTLQTGTMNSLVPIMQALVKAEEGLLGFLKSHETVTDSLGIGMAAGGVALAAGMTATLVRGVTTLFGSIFGSAAVTSAAEGAAVTAARVGMGALIGGTLGSAVVVTAAATAAALVIKEATKGLGQSLVQQQKAAPESPLTAQPDAPASSHLRDLWNNLFKGRTSFRLGGGDPDVPTLSDLPLPPAQPSLPAPALTTPPPSPLGATPPRAPTAAVQALPLPLPPPAPPLLSIPTLSDLPLPPAQPSLPAPAVPAPSPTSLLQTPAPQRVGELPPLREPGATPLGVLSNIIPSANAAETAVANVGQTGAPQMAAGIQQGVQQSNAALDELERKVAEITAELSGIGKGIQQAAVTAGQWAGQLPSLAPKPLPLPLQQPTPAIPTLRELPLTPSATPGPGPRRVAEGASPAGSIGAITSSLPPLSQAPTGPSTPPLPHATPKSAADLTPQRNPMFMLAAAGGGIPETGNVPRDIPNSTLKHYGIWGSKLSDAPIRLPDNPTKDDLDLLLRDAQPYKIPKGFEYLEQHKGGKKPVIRRTDAPATGPDGGGGATPQAAGSTININLTVPAGASHDEIVRIVSDHLSRGLSRAMAYNAGPGYGSHQSPFVSGLDL